jgi:S-DNA-T family DNA segregation ATPase FtsK/SpoIIIE
MARKKKKQTVKSFLFFEISGIVIVLLSILILANESSIIGTLFTTINKYLMGNLHFLIPLICIYIGLYAMIKRSWPSGWTKRRTGVFLFLLAITLHFHIELFPTHPDFQLSSSAILSETWHRLSADTDMALGGGMIGAILFSTSYLLFANTGSFLLMLALYLISVMLIFHLSYVNIGKWVTSRIVKASKNNETDTAQQQVDEENQSTSWFKKFFQKNPKKKESDDEELMPLDPYENTVNQSHEFQQLHVVDSAIEETTIDTNETLVIRDFNEQLSEKLSEKAVELNDENKEQIEKVLDFPIQQLELSLYTLPSLQLLAKPISSRKNVEQNDMMGNARKLEKTLENFGVRAKVIEVHRGPAVTRYELQPDIGVKVSRIVSLTDDIALALAAKDIRMEAPIPGKSAIGIEVPNSEVAVVTMREVMESTAFHDSNAKLSIAFGRDISGQPIVGNLAKMPHLLVAGATGSGKSVCINGIIISILYKAKPDEVKFLMVDPKMVELNMYNGIPHLLAPVVTDPRRASLALKKVVVEMEKRYELFSKTGTRNIEGYNQLVLESSKQNENMQESLKSLQTLTALPYIVVIVDELADLMMVAANDVEDAICRLAQMARAAGIHLIIATQRPSVDVITGVIKANIPSRIAFGVSSQIDSRTILDSGGAEKLLGRGDMLYLPVGSNKPLRVQGAFLSDKEVEAVVEFCKTQEKAVYQEDLVPEVEETTDRSIEFEDELFDQAVMIVIEGKQASVSYLQRRLRIGYTRAARLIDMMEAKAIVGPYEGSKPREVLMTADQFQQIRK